ncbi:MAG: ion channel, partial [Deltaproteobacteria bacterium]|nr:ion channel [Deltaproteobacteria bacterium]
MPSDGSTRHRVTRMPGSGREVVSIGLRDSPLRDLYHSLLTARWAQFFGLVLFAYLGANLAFAFGYLAIGDGIEEARPGNFSDAFFFSVQTMATIGYGKMAPRGLAANLLVTLEALIGLLGLALVTGLVFAKFAR